MNYTDTIGLGKQLREARKGAGLSQARTAGLTGCSVTHLQNLEAGAVPRKSAALCRIWDVIAQASVEVGREAENRNAQRGELSASDRASEEPAGAEP